MRQRRRNVAPTYLVRELVGLVQLGDVIPALQDASASRDTPAPPVLDHLVEALLQDILIVGLPRLDLLSYADRFAPFPRGLYLLLRPRSVIACRFDDLSQVALPSRWDHAQLSRRRCFFRNGHLRSTTECELRIEVTQDGGIKTRHTGVVELRCHRGEDRHLLGRLIERRPVSLKLLPNVPQRG